MSWYDDINGARLWELTHPGQSAQDSALVGNGSIYIDDDGSTYTVDANGNVVNVTNSTDTPDISLIQRVMNAGQRFTAIYDQFVAVDVSTVPPDMQPRWIQTASQATALKTQLDNAAAYASNAWGFVKSQFGLSGARSIGLGALGIVPLVAWGALAAGLLAITAVMQSQYLDYQLALQGKPRSGGVFGDLANAAKWIGIAGLAFVLLPKVLEKK